MRKCHTSFNGLRLLAQLGAAMGIVAAASSASANVTSSTVFISQFHYDNTGTDAGECIEISGPAGTDLSTYSIVLYNGSNGAVYTAAPGPGPLSGIIPNQGGTGYGALSFSYPVNGIQNGSPDAIALVQGSTCIELLSYEGTFGAVGGACAGLTTTDIGVSEAGTEPLGQSLSRTGAGLRNVDLVWSGPASPTCDGVLNFTPGSVVITDRTIMTIQGSDVSIGSQSPFVGTQVRTTGVVTAVFQGGTTNMGGFYIQDAAGDGNINTSDGIFVASATPVVVGQTVRVTGAVVERDQGDSLDAENAPAPLLGGFAGSETSITATLVEVTAPGPTNIPATNAQLPIVDTTDDGVSADGVLERLEGMLVHVTTTASDRMMITQNYFLGRYGQLTLASPRPGSSVLDRAFQPTQVELPSTTAASPARLEWLENAGRILVLDDADESEDVNPTPYNNNCTSVLRAGDSVGGLTGILDWGKINSDGTSDYRLQPLSSSAVAATITHDNPRPAAPNAAGQAVVVAFNVLNYFTDFQTGAPGGSDFRGAFTAEEFKRQTDKLVSSICALTPDIAGLVELQNRADDLPIKTLVDGGTFPGTGANPPVVINGLNDTPGCGTFTAILTGVNGTDAIKNGLIYKASRATPVGVPSFITDGLTPQRSRPTLVQRFTVGGKPLTVAVNHLKSKGSACTIPNSGNLSGNCDAERVTMATNVRNGLNAIGGDILAIGDFNSYAKEDPVRSIFVGAGWLDTVIATLGTAAQDYVFDGTVGTLTYAMASPSLGTKNVRAEEWRINSDEASILEYGTPPWFVPAACYAPNPFRSADHDPIRVAINFGGGVTPVPALGNYGLAVGALGLLGLGLVLNGRRRRASK